MGWVAFAVTRPNGEKKAVIFPKIETQFEISITNATIDEIIAYPDFPVEANFLASEEIVENVQKFGYGNTLNAYAYAGETWTLNNGSKMVFGQIYRDSGTSFTSIEVIFYDPSGKRVGNTVATKNSGPWKEGSIGSFPCLTGSGKYGNMPTAYFKTDKISYPGDKMLPTNISDNSFFSGATPIYDPKDPYGDGGESSTGGGSGSFDGTGDDISIPSLPTLSATDAGFITLFNPSIGDMRSLASYMWSDLFDADGWKKVFADPMDAILGLSIVPVAIPSSGTKPVSVGNISTGISMPFASTQYVSVDCGTLNVNEFWGAYLDYDPYTKAEIYLPYIGIHPLSTDDIMNKPVHVVYHVDILSGACCAYVQCGGTVLYSFIGQCSSSIPITGDNWTNVINGAISIAGSIGTMVATGGASAPMSIGQIASTAVNTMKPTVEKSGAMGGTGGMLGVQTPYLILTRPRQALPRDQNAFIGYPSFITELLGDLSGYTEIDSIHLENVPATDPELSEIENFLKGGVIF